jgi:hypothetical protein
MRPACTFGLENGAVEGGGFAAAVSPLRRAGYRGRAQDLLRPGVAQTPASARDHTTHLNTRENK